MAGNDTITIYRGEDVDLDFTMSPVVNVSGWTIAFNVKSASSILVTKAGSVTDGAAGEMQVSLSDAETDPLVPGTYLYDLWRTDAGAERALAVGNFVVKDVARGVT